MENISKDQNVGQQKSKKKAIVIIVIISVLIIGGIIAFVGTGDLRTYNKAIGMMKNQDYSSAKEIFLELEDYKDSATQVKACDYQIALLYIEDGEYENALNILSDLDYEDSTDKANLCEYEIAKELYNNGDYAAASQKFTVLSANGYEDSNEYLIKSSYELGKQYLDEGNYESAVNCLDGLNYEDSEKLVESIVNGTYSLNKFVERYNAMVDVMKDKEGITIEKLDANNLSIDQLTTGTGGTITFNNAADEEIDCRYEITSFMWEKSPWIFSDANALTADWYCCVAGFTPDSTYESVGDIIGDMVDSSGGGIYGSTYVGDLFYNISKTKSTITISGQFTE